jgi:hypothetical protein
MKLTLSCIVASALLSASGAHEITSGLRLRNQASVQAAVSFYEEDIKCFEKCAKDAIEKSKKYKDIGENQADCSAQCVERGLSTRSAADVGPCGATATVQCSTDCGYEAEDDAEKDMKQAEKDHDKCTDECAEDDACLQACDDEYDSDIEKSEKDIRKDNEECVDDCFTVQVCPTPPPAYNKSYSNSQYTDENQKCFEKCSTDAVKKTKKTEDIPYVIQECTTTYCTVDASGSQRSTISGHATEEIVGCAVSCGVDAQGDIDDDVKDAEKDAKKAEKSCKSGCEEDDKECEKECKKVSKDYVKDEEDAAVKSAEKDVKKCNKECFEPVTVFKWD